MCLKTIWANSLLLTVLLISEIAIAYDYIPDDEVATANLDILNSDNSGEYYDPVQEQEKNYQELNYKIYSEEDNTQKGVYTTLVPDYIHMFADMMNNSEDTGYMKDDDDEEDDNSNNNNNNKSSRSNESRLTNTNEPASFSMKNSLYVQKEDVVDLSKNTSDDNQMMDGFAGDYVDQLETGTTTTLTVPTVRTKQGKQIQIIKLLPHEALRNYIEDAYIRTPLAAVVDTSLNSLEKTKTLWKDALRPNAALDIVLLAFNASGVSLTYHFQNARTFLAGLDSIKDDSTGDAFHGIIKASELIPYDSAVFVSTASVPTDSNLARIAAITLLKKRIRLYLIWFGEKCFSENETQEITGGILGEVAIRSGGEILHLDHSMQSTDFDGNMLTLLSDNYRGPQQLEIPVDTTMSNLQIRIDGAVQTATLETPNGDVRLKNLRKISLLLPKNDKKLNEGLEVDIPLKKFQHTSKLLLKVLPEDMTNIYHVLVRIVRIRPEFEDADVFDNVLRSMNLVDVFNDMRPKGENNEFSHESIRFPSESENFNETELKTGKQVIASQGITKIDVGIQSQLLVAPGMMTKIYFEILNLRNQPISHDIRVTDEQRFLQTLNPQRIFLGPGQAATVIVGLMIPPTASSGTKDIITFSCLGYGQASQALELRVLSDSGPVDTTPPWLTWTFGSRCDGYNTGSCSNRFWRLDITGQDWDSGILRFHSVPNRILPREQFTVGTTEAVKVTYSASCCEPRVTITVYDLAGNHRSATIDVRDIVLTEASIAAIVLGVLLLILLIILVIGLIVWCCKRRESRDLPSFRSHPERTR